MTILRTITYHGIIGDYTDCDEKMIDTPCPGYHTSGIASRIKEGESDD